MKLHLALAIAGLVAAVAPAQAQEVTLKVHHFLPASSFAHTVRIRMPNHNALSLASRPKKSMPRITGNSVGTVSRIIDISSMTQPRMM